MDGVAFCLCWLICLDCFVCVASLCCMVCLSWFIVCFGVVYVSLVCLPLVFAFAFVYFVVRALFVIVLHGVVCVARFHVCLCVLGLRYLFFVFCLCCVCCLLLRLFARVACCGCCLFLFVRVVCELVELFVLFGLLAFSCLFCSLV